VRIAGQSHAHYLGGKLLAADSNDQTKVDIEGESDLERGLFLIRFASKTTSKAPNKNDIVIFINSNVIMLAPKKNINVFGVII